MLWKLVILECEPHVWTLLCQKVWVTVDPFTLLKCFGWEKHANKTKQTKPIGYMSTSCLYHFDVKCWPLQKPRATPPPAPASGKALPSDRFAHLTAVGALAQAPSPLLWAELLLQVPSHRHLQHLQLYLKGKAGETFRMNCSWESSIQIVDNVQHRSFGRESLGFMACIWWATKGGSNFSTTTIYQSLGPTTQAWVHVSLYPFVWSTLQIHPKNPDGLQRFLHPGKLFA